MLKFLSSYFMTYSSTKFNRSYNIMRLACKHASTGTESWLAPQAEARMDKSSTEMSIMHLPNGILQKTAKTQGKCYKYSRSTEPAKLAAAKPNDS